MLQPLFSPNCLLVGWLEPAKFLFDANMNYAAFIANGHCWSGTSGLWLGPVIDGHLYDTDGRPVAWTPGSPLRGVGRPLRPVNVVRAVRPVRPVMPIAPPAPLQAPTPPGGWSPLGFEAWLVANDLKPAEADEACEDDQAARF